jgi:hypothetical protein|tara:strand:- start:5405 stop:5674 length:270 start_codon:yes stop_codon:yes gene_type:complete
MYFFSRECPRLLLRAIEDSTTQDVREWIGSRPSRMIAYIEREWIDRFNECALHRYAFDSVGFGSLNEAGMHLYAKEITMFKLSHIDTLE